MLRPIFALQTLSATLKQCFKHKPEISYLRRSVITLSIGLSAETHQPNGIFQVFIALLLTSCYNKIMEKMDFKKLEKQFYQPKKIEILDVPAMSFLTVDGMGAPADRDFQAAIGLLYPVAYAISMSYKQENVIIADFVPFVVPPLEGLWTSKTADYQGNKEELIWKIMLRMPDFVTDEVVSWAKNEATRKKKQDFSAVRFETLTDGVCVQAMHLGSFDNEPETFDKMVNFAKEAGYQPVHRDFHHREIYISDFRKTAPEKMKTVLRQFIEKRE